MKKPVTRCACVEGITRSVLLNRIILPLADVYTWVCPASWEVQNSFSFLIPRCFLKLMQSCHPHVQAVLLGTFGCRFPIRSNKPAFSLWEG